VKQGYHDQLREAPDYRERFGTLLVDVFQGDPEFPPLVETRPRRTGRGTLPGGGANMTERASGAATRGLATVLMMVGSLWLCGCGASIKSFCEDTCDCEGCSDAALEECIEEGEELAAEAEEQGCGDEWDDFLDCGDDSFECEEGNATFDESCEDLLDDCIT
jgi:hypothetical protein